MILTEESKLLWHADRVKEWLDGEPIAPITIDMALTQACNLKCEYCYGQLQQQPNSEPWTVPMMARFAQDCQAIGVKAVSLVSDGESTCNRYWDTMVLLLSEHGIDVAIGTNGALFNNFDPVFLRRLTYIRFNLSTVDAQAFKKIHGASPRSMDLTTENIASTIHTVRYFQIPTTVGVQMVFMPHYERHVLPLAQWCKDIGVDYFQIKHCSDDECGSLGVDYSKYAACEGTLKAAEAMTTEDFEVQVKWRKIRAGNQRSYSRCLAPPFHLQISGSGLVAPCGMFFHPRYEQYHLGNLHKNSFREIWGSPMYWEVMQHLASTSFDARRECGCLCLQDASNVLLNDIVEGKVKCERPDGLEPRHINFV